MRRALVLGCLIGAAGSASAAEICGNAVDDDGDDLADEGCYPGLTTDICESPLSCADTGLVSPGSGNLHYNLPPDVSPGVPWGPNIGLRRFFLSQAAVGATTPPVFQAEGVKAEGTGAVSPAWPAHQTGDIALLIVETAGGEPATLSNAQGFASVSGSPQGDNVDLNGTVLTVWWKRATSSAQAAPTVADSGNHTFAKIITFRGAIATGNPWDVTAGNATAGTGATTFAIPGGVTTTANTLVVAITTNDSTQTASGWANPDLVGVTERVDQASGFGNNGGMSVATGVKVTAGTYGATTGTLTAVARQARLSIALKAADNAPAWRRPLGERWSHTYLTWLDKYTAPTPDQVVVHTSRGQDILFKYASTASGWDLYTPQPGHHFTYLRQRTTSPFEYELRTLTGEVIAYSSTGRLTEVRDSLATPNKVLVANDGNGQVSTVTDASGKRRLLFAYTSNQLTSVAFQILIASVWTTQHTTTYGYNNGLPTLVTIGGEYAQTNVYNNGLLEQVQAGLNGDTLVAFAYDATTPGRVVRVDTPRGMVGFEYASTRASCSGKSVLYFHRGNTTSCSVDADCGSGFLCGGKTSTGTTGVCFRAARCLTVAAPSEEVVTTVTALGPPSETCDGACLDVAQYIWNTAGGVLDLKAMEDPSGKFLTQTFDGNGMPTRITYGDADADPTNGNSAREIYLYYGNANFPGLVTETRRKSELNAAAASCSATNTSGCARTLTTYDANGLISTVQELGDTLAATGAVTSYNHTTTYTYDAAGKGRLAQIDGPLAGSNDVTVFEYWSSTDPLKDGFLQNLKRKKDASSFLTQSSLAFDFWGNATALQDPDGTLSCQTFSAARNTLTEQREAMAGQSTCSANAADLVTSYLRDGALRLTKLTRPDGSCMHYEYDTQSRLVRTKSRDDCNPASAGDKQEFTYSADGLLTKTETFNTANTVTRRQELTYFDSRRLEKILNPVNPAKWTGRLYDPRGMVNDLTAFDGATSLSKTQWTFNAEGRIDQEKRYTAGAAFDTWTLLFDWAGSQKQLADGDAKVTQSIRDDLGRLVKLASPDLGGFPTVRVYDAANRLTTVVESLGGAAPQTHNYTYDLLGRLLEGNYQGACTGAAPHAELQRVYDVAPPSSCPTGMTCGNTAGRLAYVKSTLLCALAYEPTDGALDQETWYQYDAAGRLIREYIKDDTTRTADHQYAWTKNGALQQTTTPAGAVLGATYGSAGSNVDTDRVTALWRTSTATPIIDNVLWNPFGPLQQYNQKNTYGVETIKTRIGRNLAYRITEVSVEKPTAPIYLTYVGITEDAKGRVTGRDYWPDTVGWQDSYFLYDQQDRVLCETTTAVSTCPTSGTNIKNVHDATPPFTAAGDWKSLLRPIPGSTYLAHAFSLNAGTHQLYEIDQTGSGLRTTRYLYDGRGNRSSDDNQATLTNDARSYTYDARRNVRTITGQYKLAGTWRTYNVTNAFDDKNRRIYKSFLDTTTMKLAEWFFYYDALDRLVEVRHTPDTASASTYTVFQIVWLGDRMVLTWQTDYPSATTTKRYVTPDENGRPVELNDWPSGGGFAHAWAINPSAWAFDTNLVGPAVFQPILHAGQYADPETVAYQNDGATPHRPGLAINGLRSYDPLTGAFLQGDPAVQSSWDSYLYADGDPVGRIDPGGLMAQTVCQKKWGLDSTYDPGDEMAGYDCWLEQNNLPPGGHTGGGGGLGFGPGGDWGPLGPGRSTTKKKKVTRPDAFYEMKINLMDLICSLAPAPWLFRQCDNDRCEQCQSACGTAQQAPFESCLLKDQCARLILPVAGEHCDLLEVQHWCATLRNEAVKPCTESCTAPGYCWPDPTK
jgi:RHS repeat-associated protein